MRKPSTPSFPFLARSSPGPETESLRDHQNPSISDLVLHDLQSQLQERCPGHDGRAGSTLCSDQTNPPIQLKSWLFTWPTARLPYGFTPRNPPCRRNLAD